MRVSVKESRLVWTKSVGCVGRASQRVGEGGRGTMKGNQEQQGDMTSKLTEENIVRRYEPQRLPPKRHLQPSE